MTPTIVFAPTAERIRGHIPSEDYTLGLSSPRSVALSVAGTPSTPTVKDLTYSATSATSTASIQDCTVETLAGNPPVEFISETPAVCAVDAATGVVSYVSSGLCSIVARGWTGARRISQQLTVSGIAVEYHAVTAVASGSLREYLKEQQLAALAGVAPGTLAQRAFTELTTGMTGTPGNGGVNLNNFIRAQNKPGFDALPLDALDALMTEDSEGRWRAWISPHHYLTWQGHYTSAAKQTGVFIAIPGSTGTNGRWEIVVRWSSTPWGGTLCRLMPSNYQDYIPDVLRGSTVLDSHVPIWHRATNTFVSGDNRWVMPAHWRARPFAPEDSRAAFQRLASNGYLATGGDSGSPGFAGINGQLVAWGHTAWLSSVCSENYHNWRPEIDAAMNTLATENGDSAAGTYAALTVDLSGFTSYA